MQVALLPALVFCPALVLPVQSPGEQAAGAVLDDWHLAAAQAGESRYFSHLAQPADERGKGSDRGPGKKAVILHYCPVR